MNFAIYEVKESLNLKSCILPTQPNMKYYFLKSCFNIAMFEILKWIISKNYIYIYKLFQRDWY